MKRPIGVTIVAWLTLLSGVALFFIFGLFTIFAAVGGPYSSGTSPQLPLIFYAPLLLSVFAFIVAIMMFARVRYAWYASMYFGGFCLVFHMVLHFHGSVALHVL